jgi:hypothetical protein
MYARHDRWPEQVHCQGQFCSRSHASQYRRYGLKGTKRDANGRYHLTT